MSKRRRDVFDSPEWRETLRKAREAQSYWQKTFQTPPRELRNALALESEIRNTHQGNRP
jgi:hypothetical protein